VRMEYIGKIREKEKASRKAGCTHDAGWDS
jgi:hypothetical protein